MITITNHSFDIFFSHFQQTPLHTAANIGNEYTMDGLVKLGADINIKDKDGVSETLIMALVKIRTGPDRTGPEVYRKCTGSTPEVGLPAHDNADPWS